MRTHQRSGVGAVVLAVGLALGTPHVAYADAWGETPVRAFDFTFNGVKFSVPTGFLFGHSIKGQDRTVVRDYASITAFGPAVAQSDFCNWRIDFQYENASGKVYDTDRGPLNSSCTKYDVEREGVGNRTLPEYGKACAIFYVNGSEQARQCHFIVKPS